MVTSVTHQQSARAIGCKSQAKGAGKDGHARRAIGVDVAARPTQRCHLPSGQHNAAQAPLPHHQGGAIGVQGNAKHYLKASSSANAICINDGRARRATCQRAHSPQRRHAPQHKRVRHIDAALCASHAGHGVVKDSSSAQAIGKVASARQGTPSQRADLHAARRHCTQSRLLHHKERACACCRGPQAHTPWGIKVGCRAHGIQVACPAHGAGIGGHCPPRRHSAHHVIAPVRHVEWSACRACIHGQTVGLIKACHGAKSIDIA
jgi:hypothetical protein